MPREAKPTVVFAVSGINVDVSEVKHTIRSLTPKSFSIVMRTETETSSSIVVALGFVN